VGLWLFALAIPSQLGTALHLDLDAWLRALGIAFPEAARELLRPLLVAATVGLALLAIVYTPLQMGVAALGRERPPFPRLMGLPGAGRGIGLAVAVGLGGGLASTLGLRAVDVATSRFGRSVLEDLGAAPWASRGARVFATATLLLAAAISEEILYRGVLQHWLGRALGSSARAAAAAVGIASAVWSLAHFLNTPAPAWKLTQTFLVGLALGELARRYSVEASICAHAALNLSVVVLALGMG
jgi:membrane protease YdiL (CAAX protease family)